MSMNSSAAEPASPADVKPRALAGRWASALVVAYVALWPLPGIAETVLGVGALLAAGRMLHLRLQGRQHMLSSAAWALTSILFLGFWLPQVISAFDAIDPASAWRKAAAGLRYLPFMWLVAMSVATPERRRVTLGGLGVITAVWTVDALAQAAIGSSPLFWSLDQLKWMVSGHGLCRPEEIAAADRLSGVLGPCNLKFGQVLATLSPFLLFAAGARWGRTGWAISAAAVGVVLLLAGSRASWVTFALVLLLSGWRLLGARGMVLMLLLGVAAGVGLGVASDQLRERFVRTAMAMQGGGAGVNEALSGRGLIWSAAGCMIANHPINGVGARNFRDAFPECARNSTQEAVWGAEPALHAHQILLEILAETGILGLLLWLAAAAQAIRAWRFAEPGEREQARPAMVALLVTVFPLNTHLAFYSAVWGGVTVMLAALYAGSLLAGAAGPARK